MSFQAIKDMFQVKAQTMSLLAHSPLLAEDVSQERDLTQDL